MARLNKQEEELKINALWIEYEYFKSKGIDAPSYDMVTERANKRIEILECNYPIGTRTLAQSKNIRLIELREAIKCSKNKVTKLKALVPRDISIKIEQLYSSLEANALLAKKVEELENRLKNKEAVLYQKEIRIKELSQEIIQLRCLRANYE